eukprot:RCo011985
MGGDHHPSPRRGAIRLPLRHHPQRAGVRRLDCAHPPRPKVPRRLHGLPADPLATLHLPRRSRWDLLRRRPGAEIQGGELQAGHVRAVLWAHVGGRSPARGWRCGWEEDACKEAVAEPDKHLQANQDGDGQVTGAVHRVQLLEKGVRVACPAALQAGPQRRRREEARRGSLHQRHRRALRGGQEAAPGRAHPASPQARHWDPPQWSAADPEGGHRDPFPGGAGEGAVQHGDLQHGAEHARPYGDLHPGPEVRRGHHAVAYQRGVHPDEWACRAPWAGLLWNFHPHDRRGNGGRCLEADDFRATRSSDQRLSPGVQHDSQSASGGGGGPGVPHEQELLPIPSGEAEACFGKGAEGAGGSEGADQGGA